MGKKKKQKLIDWQEEQKPVEEEKVLTREELLKTLLKVKRKRPLIRSSHA